jgi:hypothetical protein
MLKEVIIMKIVGKELEKRAEEALKNCLSKIPFLKIEKTKKESDQNGGRPDLLITLRLPDGKMDLIVELKTSGQPRLARNAVNQLLRYRDKFPEAYGILIAPYISLRAAEICASSNIGYVDLAGNCRLSFGQVHIEKEGKPNPFAQKRELRSLYSPKAERVLRVLLNNPNKAWKTAALAKEANVSFGQVSNVKKLLNDREWIRTKTVGFVLVEPKDLLNEWTENYSFRRNRVEDYYSLKNVAEIEADLAEAFNSKRLLYALTGFSGAARLAPAVKYQRVFAYVEEREEDLAASLDLKRVTSGANLSLLYPYDDGVFYGARALEGVKIASPVQIYLDVSSFRGRGEEAANQLLKQVIEPQW